jgi:DNA-directed RNA polymerase specialized sigma24 family protein
MTVRKSLSTRNAQRLLPKAQRRRQTIVMAEVDNPYFTGAYEPTQAVPQRITAARNANESPMTMMEARGTVTKLQCAAGLRFRILFERVMAGSASPGDIKERVDGGGRPDAMSEGRMDAGRELRTAAAHLGRSTYWVVRSVCGEGRSLRDVARMAGVRQPTAKAALRSGLDDLAEVWNLASKGHRARKAA